MKDDRGIHSTAEDRQRWLFARPPGGGMSLDDTNDNTNLARGVPPVAAPAGEAGGGAPRLKVPQRRQIEYRACCWDDLLPEDHEARIVWQYVQGLNLTELYRRIKAVVGGPGQPPIDPRILVSLWLYATLRGVGSARELNRRCAESLPFEWICGGVSVNYHTLADFRVGHGELLDRLLTESIAVLRQQNLVTLDRVAQDGVKVRASAGAASFRRGPKLEQLLAEARAQVEALKAELADDPAAAHRRQQAARQRAAADRLARVQQALEQLPLVQTQKKPADRPQARVSTTDPEARVMKMADGGYRPAYNVQLATDTATQLITGVEVTNSGGDQGQLAPMVEQHVQRYEQAPAEMLVDGGFVKKEDIEKISPPHGETIVYAPVMKSKDPDRDPHTPRADDRPAVAEWRQRMATPAAREIYKQRASTAECVNALARHRGLQQFRVRGSPKVRAVILWYVLAHNLMRAVMLGRESEQIDG